MRRHRAPFASTAEQYAGEVLAGTVPACRQIQQSCRRFLEDVNGERWVFNANLVERVCRFVELLPHTEGKLAGQPIRLEPWQVWILAAIFGLIDQDGLRKHKEVFALIPRKNGKSTIAAAIALYMLVADGEAGAQVYIGANSEKQANFCFLPAKKMAQRARGLPETFGLTVNASSLVNADGGYLQRIIGKPGDGSNPHCAILDEAHENDTAEQYDTMKTGMGARRQPLLITITTAGTNTAGPCRELQLYAEQVLGGQTENERLFAAIYTIDKEDDWKDITSWRKANPNIGVAFPEQVLADYLADALARPAKKVTLCTKHLNLWQSSASAWVNMAQWEAAGTAPPYDQVVNRGYRAWLGIDLSTQIDITALSLAVQLPDGKRALYPFLFLPHAATQASKNAALYADWAAKGFLRECEGEALDYRVIADSARDIMAGFDIQGIAFDQWQGQMMAQQLAQDIIPLVQVKQTYSDMDAVMVEFEGLLAKGVLIHPNNPALNWMAQNIACATRGEQMRPVKPHGQPHLKIDGMIASLMAIGMSMQESEATPEPFIMVL